MALYIVFTPLALIIMRMNIRAVYMRTNRAIRGQCDAVGRTEDN